MQDKYLSVWNTMEDDKWYTAKELGMAAASMSAMVRRGLVVDRAGKPKQYKKMANMLVKILEILKDKDFEYFTLFKTDRKRRNKKNSICADRCTLINGFI